MPLKKAHAVHPDIFASYCGQPAGPAEAVVKVFRDSAGNIGGYSHQILIRDSPIQYLDCDGKPLALFHIFGSEWEKKKNAPIIESLRREFPLETALDCPDTKARENSGL